MQSEVKSRLIKFLAYLGIGQKTFAESVGLSAGFVNSIRVSIQPKTVKMICSRYPELNASWLLTGDGDMIKSDDNAIQEANGDNNTQIAGNGNHVNKSSILDKALDEISEQRKLVAKSQEQIDRLISLMEKMQERK